jgi:STE24 endopeptidase
MFDPVAATAGYMAQLSPAAHARATAYTQGGHWVLLWSWLIGIVVAWLILRSGVLARLGDRMERKRPHPALVSIAIAFVFSLLDAILSLPWSIYAGWWREKSYGLNNQILTAWLSEHAISVVIGAISSALFFLFLYFLIRRAPRTWWLWAGGLAAVAFAFNFLLAPILIDPLFNKYTPAPPGPVRTAIVELAQQNGVPSDKIYIYNGSKQSNRYTANVSGLFGSARVAMSDVMFKKGADISEVRGVVGHEMGHYVHNHGLWLTLFFGLRALVGFGLTALIFPFVLRLMGARGIRGIADPRGLPTLTVVTATLTLLATPITVAATRMAESDADSYSLTHAQEPDGLAEALVKTIDYRASSPSRLEEILFYDHPSVEHRVRKCMGWKAAHLAAAAATARHDEELEKSMNSAASR